MVAANLQSISDDRHAIADMSILNKADGSASWTSVSGSTAITSVNGPIEVRIRDELLGEATLELKIVPSSGAGGTRERYLEAVIRGGIKSCLLLRLHPRSLIQITCQTIATDDEESNTLDMIATIMNSVTLACVDAGILMSSILTAAVVELSGGSEHLACYSYPSKDLVVVESQGPFDRMEFQEAMTAALSQCDTVYEIMKNRIEQKVAKDNRWRDS